MRRSSTPQLLLLLVGLILDTKTTVKAADTAPKAGEEVWLHGSVADSGHDASSGTRICLNMIVKNEEETLPELLPSTVEHLAGFVICDTGSTDKTVGYLEKYFKDAGIQGTVVHHKWTDNFARNRNMCLDEVVKWSKDKAPPGAADFCDYFMFLDADQVLRQTSKTEVLNLKEMGLDEDVYYMYEGLEGAVRYSNIRLASSRRQWLWKGPVHEVLTMVDGFANIDTSKTIEGMFFKHTADGGPEGKRYMRDAIILERAHNENPNDPRTTFYLAQTYKSLQRWEDAIHMYMKRAGMSNGWYEENFVAAMETAELLNWQWRSTGTVNEKAKQHLRSWTSDMKPQGGLETVFRAFLAAHEIGTHRQEPLHRLAYLYRTELNHYGTCYRYAAMARALGPAPKSALFVDDNVYKFLVLDELCICGYYAEQYEKGVEACHTLVDTIKGALEDGTAPSFYNKDALQRIKETIGWYRVAMGEEEASEKGEYPEICLSKDEPCHSGADEVKGKAW